MPDDKRVIVSINEITDLVHNYSSGKIEDILASLNPAKAAAADCNCRCGCVGVDCSCRGSVSRVSIDDDPWRRLQNDKAELAAKLKQQLDLE